MTLILSFTIFIGYPGIGFSLSEHLCLLRNCNIFQNYHSKEALNVENKFLFY